MSVQIRADCAEECNSIEHEGAASSGERAAGKEGMAELLIVKPYMSHSNGPVLHSLQWFTGFKGTLCAADAARYVQRTFNRGIT